MTRGYELKRGSGQQPAARLSIGEVARRAGIQASAIRYYERIGLLPPPTRHSGQRRYSERVLTELAAIRLAQQSGFTLAEIRQIGLGTADPAAQSRRWRDIAAAKRAEAEALIERGREMMRLLDAARDCPCDGLDRCEFLVHAAGA